MSIAMALFFTQVLEVVSLWYVRHDKDRFVFYSRVSFVCQDTPQCLFIVLMLVHRLDSGNAVSQYEIYALVSSVLFLLQEIVRTCME